MSLLNLRANFNTASTPEKKLEIVQKFENKNPGKFFFVLSLSEAYKQAGVNFRLVDKELRSNLLKEMVLADIININGQNFLVGGLYFGSEDAIKGSEASLLRGIQSSG